jgi:DNA (cytosine-5)-methyltransferase 1
VTAPRIGSLCTGYGGLDAAVQAVFGGELAWVSDLDPGASRILTHRYPTVPNLGDLTTTDWAAVEPVDVVCGGYPCQPFSNAGLRKGTEDERHIWPFIARALGVLRPRVAIFENVAGHLRLGFDTALADLARLGFDAEWCTVRASEVGAPHQRQRLFILATAADASHLGYERGGSARGRRPGSADSGQPAANAGGEGLEAGRVEPHGPELPAAERGRREPVADADGCERRSGTRVISRVRAEERVPGDQPCRDWGKYAPAVTRWEAVTGRPAPWATDDRNRLSPLFVEWLMGLPAGWVTDVPDLTRTQQLKALGNGVVPQQAEAALRLLYARAFPTPAAEAA